jgi:hypothetical protein
VGVFEAAARSSFDIVEQETLPSGTRNLYYLRPRH